MDEKLLKMSLGSKGEIDNCKEVCLPARVKQTSEICDRHKKTRMVRRIMPSGVWMEPLQIKVNAMEMRVRARSSEST